MGSHTRVQRYVRGKLTRCCPHRPLASNLSKVIDCGTPVVGVESGIVIETINDTDLNALITFHCEESAFPMMSLCASDGEWDPNPELFECQNGTLGIATQYLINPCSCNDVILSYSVSRCEPPTALVNGYINNYSSTVDGSQITFHCGGDSPAMTSTCSNGSWIPDPSDLDCELVKSGEG